MINAKKTCFTICAAAILTAQAVADPTITITAPTITFDPIDNGAIDAELYDLFTYGQPGYIELQNVLDEFLVEANNLLSPFGSQDQLAQGFANANAYSAQSATLQGFEGYKSFALMTGALIGAQLPTMDPAQLAQLPENIATDYDMYAGFAPSIAVNLGFHPSAGIRVFSPGLADRLNRYYLNLKYGSTAYEYDYTQGGTTTAVSMDTTNFGIGLNYQLVMPSKSVLLGFFKWRGISVGTGFNYQSNKVDFSTVMSEVTEEYSQTITNFDGAGHDMTASATLSATPDVNFALEMTTYSIPLEATTSVQLLWLLNMNIGVGGDLVFGNTDITANGSSDLTAKNFTITTDSGVDTSAASADVENGTVSLDAGTSGISPSLARLRVMGGLGMQLGPIKIDIPVYYYLMSGLAFGVTAGIVW